MIDLVPWTKVITQEILETFSLCVIGALNHRNYWSFSSLSSLVDTIDESRGSMIALKIPSNHTGLFWEPNGNLNLIQL